MKDRKDPARQNFHSFRRTVLCLETAEMNLPDAAFWRIRTKKDPLVQEVFGNSRLLLSKSSACCDDRLEVFRFERGSADQSAVHVGLSKERGGILGVARASVKDREVLGNLFSVFVLDHFADMGVHFLGLLRRGGQPGSDSPYGFLGQHDAAPCGGR